MIKQIKSTDLDECLSVIHKSFLTVAEEFGLTEQNAATNGAFMKLERLKNWYLKNGFIHIGTKKFDHLPLAVGFMEMPL